MNSNQKSFLFLLCAAVLAAFTGCSYESGSGGSRLFGGDFRSVTNVTKSGEIPADLKSLDVDNRFGAVRVVGTDSMSAVWSWKLTVRARTDQLAMEGAETAACAANMDGGRLILAVSLPNSDGNWSFQSDFEIRVPKTVDVRTKNRFGETEISELEGNVEAAGQNGGLDVRNIKGQVDAKTSFAKLTARDTGPAVLENQNGQIEALRIQGHLEARTSFADLVVREIDGAVNLRNQNGRVEIARVRGNADVETSFGDLWADDITGGAGLVNQNGAIRAHGVTGGVKAATSFGNLEVECSGPSLVAKNQNGNIQLRVISPALTNLEARTSFGSLNLRLPREFKPAIHARTTFGEIESDFPVLMKPRGEDPFSGVPPEQPRITLVNQNASIRVIRE